MTNRAALSEAEIAVLKVLWDIGPAPVRVINGELAVRGRDWAYTTVSTLLLRLATKGCAIADSSVVPHLYRASVSREEMLGRRLRDAADELCDGEATPLVHALVKRHRFTPEELAGFQKLIDEARAAEASGNPIPSPEDRARDDPKKGLRK